MLMFELHHQQVSKRSKPDRLVSDHIFVTGGSTTNATELLNVVSWKWERRSSFPYERIVFDAPVAYIDQKFFIFGGDCGGRATRIAAYSPIGDSWQEMGNLGWLTILCL